MSRSGTYFKKADSKFSSKVTVQPYVSNHLSSLSTAQHSAILSVYLYHILTGVVSGAQMSPRECLNVFYGLHL